MPLSVQTPVTLNYSPPMRAMNYGQKYFNDNQLTTNTALEDQSPSFIDKLKFTVFRAMQWCSGHIGTLVGIAAGLGLAVLGFKGVNRLFGSEAKSLNKRSIETQTSNGLNYEPSYYREPLRNKRSLWRKPFDWIESKSKQTAKFISKPFAKSEVVLEAERRVRSLTDQQLVDKITINQQNLEKVKSQIEGHSENDERKWHVGNDLLGHVFGTAVGYGANFITRGVLPTLTGPVAGVVGVTAGTLTTLATKKYSLYRGFPGIVHSAVNRPAQILGVGNRSPYFADFKVLQEQRQRIHVDLKALFEERLRRVRNGNGGILIDPIAA